MKSIRWKLIMMYIALVFIVMIVSGTFIIMSIRADEENKHRDELRSMADIVRDTVIDTYSADEFQKYLDISSQDGKSQTAKLKSIIDLDGNTIATNESDSDAAQYDLPEYHSSVIIEALNKKNNYASGKTIMDANGRSAQYIEYACPYFDENNAVRYVIYCRIDLTSTTLRISQTTTTIFLSIVLAMLLTGILGSIFSSSITIPISLLTTKAKELAEGKLNQKIIVRSKDEIGQLTASFNHMAKELNGTLHDIENEKNKLEIVLYNMTDGVLAYDNNGQLLHANQVGKEILNMKDFDNMSFFEIAKKLNAELDENSPIDWNELNDSTLYIGDKYISASFNAYRNNENKLEGVIIVLHDITKHKLLDDMRKDFVGNVSHEIRTPLTNIKSYTETLIDGAIDDSEVAYSFLNIINSETDRMERLVKDLTELSSLDSKQLYLNKTEVSLIALIQQTIQQIEITAAGYNKKIQFEPDPNDITLFIDEQKISQVLTNILINSVKYSGEGAKIFVEISEDKDNYIVYIRDTGVGIPKEDLRRIFERFYRVDKARSRELGGTGLGLSIAKEIIEEHGGKISASSEIGKGTTMILRFLKE